MPRQRRIEYAGAIYHAMARGNRRGKIVLDDIDRTRFEGTLGEVVQRTGWDLYAWVLMGNHYHFLFRTPEPNLVEGMKWFQNTWTRRFNVRHKHWGHLFGGRYKAILVEEGEYLMRLIHYIHLNPVRAGLVKRTQAVESYPWGSFPDYLKPLRKRRNWTDVEGGLEQAELADTVAGRRRFLEWTQECVNWNASKHAGVTVVQGQSLQSTLRRGWYFGTEAFREKLLKKLGKDPEGMSSRRQKGYGGAQTRDHGIAEAERVVRCAESEIGIRENEWTTMTKGDWRKGVVASLIRERALVDNGWLADRMQMGARNAVSRTIRLAKERLKTDRDARRLARNLTDNVK